MPQGKTEAKVGMFTVDDGWEAVGSDEPSRGRGSPIDAELEKLRAAGPQYHGTPIGVAVYNSQNTAKGSVNSLRTRFGPKEASGFVFGIRFNKARNAYAVTATYTPDVITDAGKAAHVANTAKRKETEKAARIKRQQEKNAKANQTVADTTQAQAQGVEARVESPVEPVENAA